MKITIESESGETIATTILENVYQFTICGSLKIGGISNDNFRMNVISDPNELIGLLKTSELDISDYKMDKAKLQNRVPQCEENTS